MLTVRPTKMLARRLGISVPPLPPSVANLVGDWCVQEFVFDRRRYLMFCNTASLYPVVMHAARVKDGPTLVARLMGGLQSCLVGGELERQFRRSILPESSELQWAPIPGRSILGSMNDLINMAVFALEDGVATPIELSRRIAHNPMSVLGGNSPHRGFPKLRG